VSPATWPRGEPLDERMLVVDVRAKSIGDSRVADLPEFLGRGDVLVVNDAATLPASLAAETESREAIELRLAAANDDGTWTAALLGAGDWRSRTEDRPAPPRVAEGARLRIAPELDAIVVRVSPISPRLVDVRFSRDSDALYSLLYRYGRPVQYAYVAAPLELWHAQTPFASRPWAFEMPCAGRPLRWELVRALEKRGVVVASLTHAAGLSSTGDPAIDRALPLPERFEIPRATADAIASAKRVVAVGTTVVRALEGCAALHDGRVAFGTGVTSLKIDAAFRPRVVHALLTGMHAPATSHFDLMTAFAPRELLDRASAHAERERYLEHEFGDSTLVLT
jgi:S-adenosylmethionine:tRNA ribosyltransferase-isomerase